jgi:hypothetical protein
MSGAERELMVGARCHELLCGTRSRGFEAKWISRTHVADGDARGALWAANLIYWCRRNDITEANTTVLVATNV